MNKIDKFLGYFFIFLIPLLGIFIFINYLIESKTLNDVLGLILIVWIIVSLYLFIKMIISSRFRNLTLKRFVKVKEADERESQISGEAAKLSMISTFALMTLLIFLSTLTVSVGKIQGEPLFKSDRRHYITIGFDPMLMNKSVKIENGAELFTYSGLPIPISIILLLILCWQLFTYHFIVRKILNE